MQRPIVIYGNGATAKKYDTWITYDSLFDVAAFTVDRAYMTTETYRERPLVPFDALPDIYPPQQYDLFIAVGWVQQNRVRAAVFDRALTLGYRLVNFISRQALILPDLKLGRNVAIGPQTHVSFEVDLGDDVHIGAASRIGPYTAIGAHTYVSSGVAVTSKSRVGSFCRLRAESVIANGVHVADGCDIGVGAVVLQDTQPGGFYLGNPARLVTA